MFHSVIKSDFGAAFAGSGGVLFIVVDDAIVAIIYHHIVAFNAGRSVNSQVLVLIRDNIKAFEDTNGTIDGNITPASNVKPTRK